jgi:carbamoyl-phosphate synthase small subunit
MRANGRIGLSGVDTRALTRRIREAGAPNGVIAHNASGAFDIRALLDRRGRWPGLEGMDLAKEVSCRQMFRWSAGGGHMASAMPSIRREGGRPTSSRSIMARNATSSATSPMPARG